MRVVAISMFLPILLLLSSMGLCADPTDAWKSKIQSQKDWSSFETEMEALHDSQGILGSSYIASGAIVTIGGLVGQQRSGDSSSRFVFGVSQGLGLLAVGYGIQILSTGNEFESFYDAARGTDLSLEQKNQLLRIYLSREKERQKLMDRITIGTHILIAGFNFYSASIETDSGSKNIMNSLGLLNLGIAFAYSF